jgi:hypothetical protein
MPRALSEVEQQYIEENHTAQTAEEMAKDMKGVSTKTVQAYVDTLPPPAKIGETHEERQRALQSTKVGVGRLMGRDPDRGVTVMTEAASELADARKVVAVTRASENQRKRARGMIHRPFSDGPYDR